MIRARSATAARAAAQVPNKRLTTLADGHAPAASRSSACAPLARVRARPVIRRRQPSVSLPPVKHRGEHELPRPPALDRAGVADLAVGVRITVAVARLCARAAATADADVAGLDGSRLRARGVVEVRLDRCRRTTESVGDLPDREALDLAEMLRQGDCRADPALYALPVTPVTLSRSIGVSVAVGAPASDAPNAVLLRATARDNGHHVLQIATGLALGVWTYANRAIPCAATAGQRARPAARCRPGFGAGADTRVGTGDLAGAMALAEGEASGVTNLGGSA